MNIVARSLVLTVVLVGVIAAQDLAAINTAFDKKLEDARIAVLKDKVKALEKFIKDPKNKDHKDLGKAMLAAASTAVEANSWKDARAWADQVITRVKEGEDHLEARAISGRAAIKARESVETASKLLLPVIEGAEMKEGSVDRALECATALATYLVDAGDKKGAEKVWDTLKVKLTHPQIHEIADTAIKNLEILGTPPKAFTVKDLAGKDLSLDQYKGKVVLLDFWATWCGPCIGELPNVIAAYKKYHDQGFEIVGISLDESREKLDAFLKDHDLPWRQFFDGKGWKNEVAELYGIQSIPATYLIDRNGNIARVGARGDALKEAVETLLAKK